MAYATKTSVPIERSKTEVERILTKYGATAFMFMTQLNRAAIAFEMKGMRIQFVLPLPKKPDEMYRGLIPKWEQESRSKWRSLVLCIKAKLESVDAGITTVEQEFLAHIVLPNGSSVGDFMIPQIAESYKNNKMPPLLLGGK